MTPADSHPPASDSGIILPDAPTVLHDRLRSGSAIAWREPITIRTHETDAPSPYPMFFDRRVYQGSRGAVYPLPFIEGVSDEGAPREWQAVHLENAHLRLVVLPELGGRIHIGYDKDTAYDFFYRNNVIKPALVGLAGPWISGGVEFNWPQHHRPATHLPVDTVIEQGDDGSVTVWCHDHDPFTRMSAHHGIRLRAGSSVVELVVRLHNRTSERQSFLWWANVAARVHADYQSFFPEDVRYVADHARRALTAFPAADRPYYNVDYPALAAETPGADRIDWYRNIPVPTSYMIVDSEQDFFGGYDHAAGAGFVHWAERRVSPGKKQWTWGDSPFGRAWDDQLTDDDGPYVELMAGVHTDNQPDFSWLLPGETKTFTQYWYPIPAIGVAHQATPDAAVHVGRGDTVSVAVAVTSTQPGALLRVHGATGVLDERGGDLVPGAPFTLDTDAAPDDVVAVELLDAQGRSLVRWTPSTGAEGEPWVADEPPLPADIDTVEELYLTGVHLSQNRHPTRSPLAYWQEALDRDPGDVRTNLAVAEHENRAGRVDRASQLVDAALDRLTRRNANPMDAEAFYLRGLVSARQGRHDEARRAFGKAGWDGAWAGAAGLELARSLARAHHDRAALRVLDALDDVAGHDPRRTAVRVVLWRRGGRTEDAARRLADGLVRDPLDATLRALDGRQTSEDAGLLLDVAGDLAGAGALEDALEWVARAISAPVTAAGDIRPVAWYTAALLLDEHGRGAEAQAARAAARRVASSWAFPHGAAALAALEAAVQADDQDAAAASLLGTLLYSLGRREEARESWERAISLGASDRVVLRNAALAAFEVDRDSERALELYARAVVEAPGDPRLRFEQDQLRARVGIGAAERLAELAAVEDVVLRRDDLTIAYVRLLVAEGEAERALDILRGRRFHPWEGGEGQTIAAWDETHAALGLPVTDPPATLGEARPTHVAPAARREDGSTDYFATSLPDLLLFSGD